MAASKPTATTVTLRHLAASLAEDNEISKKQAEAILGGLVGNIVKHLKKGERIRIGGLGILQVRKRAARMGRNPATGDRKSTRLNSSHPSISYAVFCLKKKTTTYPFSRPALYCRFDLL